MAFGHELPAATVAIVALLALVLQSSAHEAQRHKVSCEASHILSTSEEDDITVDDMTVAMQLPQSQLIQHTQILQRMQQTPKAISATHDVLSHRGMNTEGAVLHEVPSDKSTLATNESWFAGIFMTIVGQTLCVLGLQIQKISHIIHTPKAAPNKPLDDSPLRSIASKAMLGEGESLADESSYYFFQWRWMIGALIWALGHIMCWVALGLAPQSILSCLQSWNIVAALALAPVLLNESLPARAFEYAILLVIGCVIVVLYGPRPLKYHKETVTSLEQAFVTPSSLTIHIVCFGLLLLTMTSSILEQQRYRVGRYIMMSATCAWYAALFSKSLSMMVITTVASHDKQMQNLGFWVFSVAFTCFALGQIHFMNLGLKFGLASVVMPIYEAASMVGQLFFGGIMFGEFHTFQGDTEFAFLAGVVIVFAGLILIIKSTSEMTDHHDHDGCSG